MTQQEIRRLHKEADRHALRDRLIDIQIKAFTAERARIQALIYEIARSLREAQ
jgi:hypothetical protein